MGFGMIFEVGLVRRGKEPWEGGACCKAGTLFQLCGLRPYSSARGCSMPVVPKPQYHHPPTHSPAPTHLLVLIPLSEHLNHRLRLAGVPAAGQGCKLWQAGTWAMLAGGRAGGGARAHPGGQTGRWAGRPPCSCPSGVMHYETTYRSQCLQAPRPAASHPPRGRNTGTGVDL